VAIHGRNEQEHGSMSRQKTSVFWTSRSSPIDHVVETSVLARKNTDSSSVLIQDRRICIGRSVEEIGYWIEMISILMECRRCWKMQEMSIGENRFRAAGKAIELQLWASSLGEVPHITRTVIQ
jgi:hypothetical protein